jgi:hypothetical protein
MRRKEATRAMELTVSRTLGPWGAGLAGYVDGKLAVVIPVKPRGYAHVWAMHGVTKRDRERVRKAIIETEGGD